MVKMESNTKTLRIPLTKSVFMSVFNQYESTDDGCGYVVTFPNIDLEEFGEYTKEDAEKIAEKLNKMLVENSYELTTITFTPPQYTWQGVRIN